MSRTDTSFGILTLASPNDFLKAIGLALSLRASNPDVPTAVACCAKLKHLLTPYFDHVVEEHPGLRGFEHKVYLDRYTPFDTTFFFDSDVLVFRSVRPYVEQWGHPAYSACGRYNSDGFSAFGLDRVAVLRKIGFTELVIIDGAGHACFEKTAGRELFDLARSITANYADYAGNIPYADEDVMSIAMTMLKLPPSPYTQFFSRYLSAVPGTLEIDASRAFCRYISAEDGKPFFPCMMHFAAKEAPVAYTRQLRRLFRANGVPTRGLLALGVNDLWNATIKSSLASGVRSLKKTFSARRISSLRDGR